MKLPVVYNDVHWTERWRVREEYIKRQNGKCCYCGESLSDPAGEKGRKPITISLYPPDFFDHPVHLHHDRETGLTIGAVHAQCNAVSWEYDELPALRNGRKVVSRPISD